MVNGAVWDTHAHLIPPSVVDATREGCFGMSVEDGKLSMPGGALPLEKLTDLDALIGWMDERGISGAVLSVPPLLYRYDLTGEDAREWARLVNDGLAAVAAEHPDRLRALALLPLGEPELAEEEAGRTSGEPWSGLVVGSSVVERTLDDPAFEPVFEQLDRDRRFVFVHPVEALDPRLERYYLGNLLGNPYEISLAVACLVFSGMLSRYPNVRFCLAHAGGAAPYLIGRWQRGYDTERPGIRELELPPREALGRLWFDSVAHSEAALELLVREVGEEKVLLGSDYPFPMREDDPLVALENLPQDAREAIARRNHVHALDHCTEVIG